MLEKFTLTLGVITILVVSYYTVKDIIEIYNTVQDIKTIKKIEKLKNK